MRYHCGQLVQLRCAVPDLDLQVGQIGVVCTRWFEPMDFYELEFQSPLNPARVRIVLEEQQFALLSLRHGRPTPGASSTSRVPHRS